MSDYNDEHLDEDTAAAASLATHNPVSRSELMSQLVSAAATIPTPALVDFCAKTMEFIANPMGGAAPATTHSVDNRATIDMKPSAAAPGQPPMPLVQTVREDLDTVLAGQELPADQVEKLLTLFEAAVNARVQIAVTQVQEEYEASLDEQTEELVEKLDGYLEYAAKEFFTENEVAIENSLRVDLYEEFVDGLADLFRKHYVDIPEDRLDVVSSLADRVSELEERLNEKTQEAIDLEEQLLAASAQRVFNKVSEGLTTVDAEKLRSLSETVEFDGDEESLEKRISTIKEATLRRQEDRRQARGRHQRGRDRHRSGLGVGGCGDRCFPGDPTPRRRPEQDRSTR